MRILFVSHSFPLPDRPLSNVGGMQRVAVAQYRTLSEHPRVEVHPLVLETSWKWTGVRTGPFLLRLLRDIPRLVRTHRIDVVLFSSMVTASVVPLIAGRIRDAGAITAAIPVGRDVTLPNPLYQRFVSRVLKALDLLLPISRATAATCLERGAEPVRVHVVPCGVDPAPHLSADGRQGARRDLRDRLRARGAELGDEGLVLLSVGRHQERKGFHWFVDEVMPRLTEETRYLIAGSGPATPLIAERILAHGLEKRVVLLGQVTEEELHALYGGSDLFVMPNVPVPGDIEGFGVVMIEAGAHGLPVVAARLEGIQDVITDGVNGRLVESRDGAGFARAIEAYRDNAYLVAASDRAKAHVEAHFGWPGVADEYLRIFAARLSEDGANGRGRSRV